MQTGIKTKLIVSLVVANSFLAILMYWLNTQSFERGFLDYVNQAEMRKLQPLLDELGEQYQSESGWQWINEQHYLWRGLIDKHIFGQSQTQPPPRKRFREFPVERSGEFRQRPRDDRFRPPPPPRRDRQGQTKRLNIEPRVLLRDKQQQLIIGNERLVNEVQWLPILVANIVVGELGVKPLNNLSEDLEKVFAQQQRKTYAYIAIILLLAAIIVAVIFSSYFLGPIKKIKKGVHKLVAGDYEQSLKLKRNDELGQLASDFNLLSRSLKENKQSRQQWIADISHELRTPVAILKGEIDALIEGVRTVDSNALISLQQECSRLSFLINDLHELSLSDLGALSYNKEVLDMVEYFEDFVDSYDEQFDKAGIHVTLNARCKQSIVTADGDRLDQCFKNLLQNTTRYTDAPGQLVIELSETKEGLSINWEDSSPGVSDNELNQLFDRLYRVEKSRERAKGGAGLGMSICFNIIEAHDGKIRLYHSKQGGLGVYIFLPH